MDCVAVIAQNPNTGKILSISRRNDATKFGLIGGKVDPGESFKQAASREFFEETGLELPLMLFGPFFTGLDEDENEVHTFGCLFFEDEIMWESIKDTFPSPEGMTITQLTPMELCDPSISAFPEYNRSLFTHLGFI